MHPWVPHHADSVQEVCWTALLAGPVHRHDQHPHWHTGEAGGGAISSRLIRHGPLLWCQSSVVLHASPALTSGVLDAFLKYPCLLSLTLKHCWCAGVCALAIWKIRCAVCCGCLLCTAVGRPDPMDASSLLPATHVGPPAFTASADCKEPQEQGG